MSSASTRSRTTARGDAPPQVLARRGHGRLLHGAARVADRSTHYCGKTGHTPLWVRWLQQGAGVVAKARVCVKWAASFLVLLAAAPLVRTSPLLDGVEVARSISISASARNLASGIKTLAPTGASVLCPLTSPSKLARLQPQRHLDTRRSPALQRRLNLRARSLPAAPKRCGCV